jgi:lysozyme
MPVPYLHVGETKLMRQVVADLERHEGYREYAYPDVKSKIGRTYKGKSWPWGFVPARELLARIPGAKESDGRPWTYGFGFTHNVTPDSRINRTIAERMLEQLILEMNVVLANKLPWYVYSTFVTKTILINMAFNMGVAGLLKFRNTLAFVKEQIYDKAAVNMRKSLWYRQLPERAGELARRMEKQVIEPQHLAKELC